MDLLSPPRADRHGVNSQVAGSDDVRSHDASSDDVRSDDASSDVASSDEVRSHVAGPDRMRRARSFSPRAFRSTPATPPVASVTVLAIVLVFACACADIAGAARIRDIAHFRGMRENQLVGYGLIVGLDGSGDKKSTGFTLRSMSNLLESVGLTIGPDEMSVKNVAAVMVTATLEPFSRPGSQIDVTVASIGDATSLRGGVLIQTPLEGADGQVYAVAQGPISVGGFSASSPGGTQVSQNQVTVGTIPGGGIVERGVRPSLADASALELVLHRPDFTTAQRVAERVQLSLGVAADPTDPGVVRIALPDTLSSAVVGLMAQIGELRVEPGVVARVVLNERTGTIVAGGDVGLRPAAISHGNLSIRIRNQFDVYQPEPFSPDGTETAVVPYSEIDVDDDSGFVVTTDAASTLEELARALNALGVTPRDLITIFQALKAAGALDAELVIQ